MSRERLMSAWVCPSCDRMFARTHQSHECAPAMDLEEYFATGPPWERPVFDAVLAHVQTLGPIHVEPVSVGIFIKSASGRPGAGSLFELRPLARWTALSFPLDQPVRRARIARKPIRSGARWFHVVNLCSADEVDDEVRQWLTASWSLFG